MLDRLRGPIQTVQGHRIPEPRLTWQGVLLLFAAVSVPVLLLGSALDLAVQLLFGVCTGLWCVIGP